MAKNSKAEAPKAEAPKAEAATAGYTCVEPIKHNGKRYMPDDSIDLADDEATALIEQGLVKSAE